MEVGILAAVIVFCIIISIIGFSVKSNRLKKNQHSIPSIRAYPPPPPRTRQRSVHYADNRIDTNDTENFVLAMAGMEALSNDTENFVLAVAGMEALSNDTESSSFFSSSDNSDSSSSSYSSDSGCGCDSCGD